jgi:restriction system protein
MTDNEPKKRKRGQKTAKIKKYRQKNRKKLPKPLMPVPVIPVCIYLYASKDTVVTKTAVAMAIFFLAYGMLKLLWYLRYRKMLGGASMEKIDRMSGEEFEDYLALMYSRKTENGKKMFTSVETTPGTCDFGADLLLRTIDGRKAVVQAKRYRKHVPESAVQQLIAARTYYRADVGLVITNSLYTDAAKTLAKRCGVILIDRYKLGTDVMYHF